MNVEICYNSIVEFNREKFSQYIRDRYYEWRGSTDKTWTDFAEYLGVTQQTMAAWKNAYLKRTPNQENIVKLVGKFGLEIYDILGLPAPEEGSLIGVLPDDLRARLETALAEIREIYAAGDDPRDPSEIAASILAQHGFTINASK